MVDVEEYFSKKLSIVPENVGNVISLSPVNNDYSVVSRFLSSDEAFSQFEFLGNTSSLYYPLRLNLTCGTYILDTLLVNSSSDFDVIPDWLLDSPLPEFFTVADGSVDSRIIQLAGDRELPLLLLRSDVSDDEITSLTTNTIILKNINRSTDPADRATLISFSSGWRVTTNSSSLNNWVAIDRSPDFEILSISLATIFAVVYASRHLKWLISRLTGIIAFVLSLWLGHKTQCCGCSCCN